MDAVHEELLQPLWIVVKDVLEDPFPENTDVRTHKSLQSVEENVVSSKSLLGKRAESQARGHGVKEMSSRAWHGVWTQDSGLWKKEKEGRKATGAAAFYI